jgi:uncharacterized alpha/beta hydrolase family protein
MDAATGETVAKFNEKFTIRYNEYTMRLFLREITTQGEKSVWDVILIYGSLGTDFYFNDMFRVLYLGPDPSKAKVTESVLYDGVLKKDPDITITVKNPMIGKSKKHNQRLS